MVPGWPGCDWFGQRRGAGMHCTSVRTTEGGSTMDGGVVLAMVNFVLAVVLNIVIGALLVSQLKPWKGA